MFGTIKHLSLAVLISIVGFTGYRIYWYTFDTHQPTIEVSGIHNNACYAYDLTCSLSSNKSGNATITLDNEPFITNCSLHSKKPDYMFTIPITTMKNGVHQLRIEVTDNTFRKNKNVREMTFQTDTMPLQATFIKPDPTYKVFQGKTLHVQFQVNKPIKMAKIHALAQEYPCFPESKYSLVYEAFVPIACEELPNEYLFSVEVVDLPGNNIRLDSKFEVMPFLFKKSSLHVQRDLQEAEQELGKSRLLFEEKMTQLTKTSVPEKLWCGAFCTPIDIQKITTEFGTVRTTQEKGRYMHKAVDVINSPKSVVWSTQDGIVALKERFADSGNTVVIDHGCGILSLFFHLDDFADIQVGQKVAKGNPIGKLGKTGYASGYHLHWEMRINNIAIDPLQWTKSTF